MSSSNLKKLKSPKSEINPKSYSCLYAQCTRVILPLSFTCLTSFKS